MTHYNDAIIKPGDKLSKVAFQTNQKSYNNSAALRVFPDQSGDFRGDPIYVTADHISELMMQRRKTDNGLRPIMSWTQATDGGGHKPCFATTTKKEKDLRNLSCDILRMCDHDILRSGGLPVLFTNQMDINRITAKNFQQFQWIFDGFSENLKKSHLVSFTGEAAIMPYAVTSAFDTGHEDSTAINWVGNCTGLHHIDKFISGKDVTANMFIVGMWEPGLRCNGSTLLIDLLLYIYKTIDKIYNSTEAMTLIEQCAIPSANYANTILRTHGWNRDGTVCDPLVKIALLRHITGGGIWWKLNLPKGIGAVMNNMFAPAPALVHAQELSWGTTLQISDWHCHQTFHGGPGMIALFASETDANIFIDESKKDGVKAQIIGMTTDSPDSEVIIHSKFKEGKILSSLKPE